MQTTRYRKLPVEINAIQFDGTRESAIAVMKFIDAGPATHMTDITIDDLPGRSYIGIHTLEGVMRATPGDWIIRGVKGELYPCRHDIFAATYEPAGTPTAGPSHLTTPGLAALAQELDRERQQQLTKFGDQRHPDGTGSPSQHVAAGASRARCQIAAEQGSLTWQHILDEEVREALAESDPTALRAELIQISAVCAAWISDIDRRPAANEPSTQSTTDSTPDRCPAAHGALGRICELKAGHPGMHTGAGRTASAVWDGDASV